MLKKNTSFIVKGNQIFQVYGVLPNEVIVYDRKSTTGLTTISEYDEAVDTLSDLFEVKFKQFLSHINSDLNNITDHEGYDDWNYKVCVMSNVAKACGLESYITDDEDDDVRSEITVRMTYEYLANLTAPQKLHSVKLYVIEQLLQKSYYHILNDEWLMDKAINPEADTYDYSNVEVVMPEGV
jgi:hypothetical protein